MYVSDASATTLVKLMILLFVKLPQFPNIIRHNRLCQRKNDKSCNKVKVKSSLRLHTQLVTPNHRLVTQRMNMR